MYIYKMVFLEREELSEKAQEVLEESGIMATVDYGNTEIDGDMVRDYFGEQSMVKPTAELAEALAELPSEILEALKNGEINMVQVIY